VDTPWGLGELRSGQKGLQNMKGECQDRLLSGKNGRKTHMEISDLGGVNHQSGNGDKEWGRGGKSRYRGAEKNLQGSLGGHEAIYEELKRSTGAGGSFLSFIRK